MPAPDPLSLRQAARAVAGALVVDDLARKTARALVEVNGAKCAVVAIGNVVAEARADEGVGAGRAGARVVLRTGRDQGVLPREIASLVERDNGAVVLQDGALESTFRAGPEGAQARPGSVIAAPMLVDGEVAGIGYVEDSRANAFDPAHVEATLLLLDLAATSLVNARSYDALAERLEEGHRELGEAVARNDDAAQRLRAQERLASLGTIASGIAHEIKNPLNFVNNFAEITVGLAGELAEELERLRGSLDAASAAYLAEIVSDLAQNAAKIHEHGKRADGIVKGMLEHARGRAGRPLDVDFNALVREYAMSACAAQPGPTPHRAYLEWALDPSIGRARVVPEEFGRVILNLVSNALDATRARRAAVGDGFSPLVHVSTRSLGDRVEVRIRDNGGGIPASIKDSVYQPFFTTKPAGEGTGLGLPLSREIVVDRHAGEIEFETEEGKGTEFIVTLPKRGAEAVGA